MIGQSFTTCSVGKDTQIVADIVEEINVEDIGTTNNLEKGNNYHRYEDDVSLDEMDASATQSQSSNEQISTSITDDAMLLGENIRTVGLELNRSIAFEKVLQESAQKLYPALYEVKGLIEDERYRVLRKIPDHPIQMLIFFSLPSFVRLEW
ncbi:hypothetical protein Gogos_015467, partial [Gossypium gossypioides]|nr:hypothetical protein [Gossypium gossypioides]